MASLSRPAVTIRPGAVRASRRTSLVVAGPDTVELCEPECRNEFLLDLGVPGRGGGWVYPPAGAARVHVAWSQRDYDVAWRRRRINARPCDLCWDAWQFQVPDIVAAARARSEAMKGRLTTGLRPFSAQGAGLGVSGAAGLISALDDAGSAPGAAECVVVA